MGEYNKPIPNINSDSKEFWVGCKKHELRFQKCKACGHVRWPASIICPVCYSKETEWMVAGGKGRIYTFVIYHVAYHPGFQNDLPYVVADVELEEGPRLLTNIVGCRPDEVRCEMLVEVIWEDITEEFSLPKFKPYC
jgi:uncharacterized OB-fold protein